jgi:CubicO group peptidase (beta-lactamase class C family)
MNAPTLPDDTDVDEYIRGIPDERRRAEAVRLKDLFDHTTGLPARMWGTMIGYGDYHYKYESGREGDTFIVGFAPRKAQLVIYGIHNEYDDPDAQLLSGLGAYTTGKSCVYIKRLDGVDIAVLETLVRNAAADGARAAEASGS